MHDMKNERKLIGTLTVFNSSARVENFSGAPSACRLRLQLNKLQTRTKSMVTEKNVEIFQ